MASSSGKLFVPNLTPRTTNEYLVGTARQMNSHLSARAYGRYRETKHFWEDTNNTARVAFNPPATVNGVPVPQTLYIPDLTAKLAQIGSGSSYVITELDGAYTKYWEGTVELEFHSTKGMANLSYTRSHYYGNFDQDNSTTASANDGNIFIGSSNIGDSAGRQLWDNKQGDLHGDRPNLFKVSGIRYLHWKASAGFFFVFQSGSPWESTNYEIYKPLVGSSTSDTNRYGEPAGSRRTDSHYQLDLNYSQDIKIDRTPEAAAGGERVQPLQQADALQLQPSVHSSTLQHGAELLRSSPSRARRPHPLLRRPASTKLVKGPANLFGARRAFFFPASAMLSSQRAATWKSRSRAIKLAGGRIRLPPRRLDP